jgi:uncharacterized membrane protein HdeD (DUF308 family)
MLAEDVKRHASWSIITGVLTAALGVFLITYPLLAATITAIFLGCLLICVGVAQFFFAIHSHTFGRVFLKVLSSVLYVLAGLGMLFFPIKGVIALTMIAGALLLIYSGGLAITAFELRPFEGWKWFLLDAAASFVMAVLILAGWPSSALWAIGTLVGVAVLMGGISRIMLAVKVRSIIISTSPGNIPRAA